MIQTKEPCIGENFLTGIQNWSSSTRVEITAITIVLLIIPLNNKVIIYTDNQNSIDIFNRLTKINPKLTQKKWIKENNWSLWLIIIDIIKKRNLDLTLKKVKAHANNFNNNKADLLAKTANQAPIIQWNNIENSKIKAIHL